jgi:hypothetical protein
MCPVSKVANIMIENLSQKFYVLLDEYQNKRVATNKAPYVSFLACG